MYTAITANKRNTWFIMLAFMILIAGMGYLYSAYMGNGFIFWAVFIGAGLYTIVQYFAAAKIALTVTGAKEISKSDNPRLWRIVENLSITNGQPMPKVYILPDSALNAFATGRDPQHAHVAATIGIIEALNDRELEAVMAHEMGHVKNYDIRVSMIAFGLVSVIGMLADWLMHFAFFGDNRDRSPVILIMGLVGAILAPIVAGLIQAAISRQREYLADATSALTTRDPEALATALEKIAAHGSQLQRQNPSAAHLFFANPLGRSSIASLFSTHPPVEQRIARLRTNATRM